ncbi:MAG: prolyl oligopeptidase family serine peptidase [Kiritimatiellia bacterium]|jgi:dienelactone hydrolase|nr:prolyl oligopeptidase family serine peptidase [Kiritimatiellia bacterium]
MDSKEPEVDISKFKNETTRQFTTFDRSRNSKTIDVPRGKMTMDLYNESPETGNAFRETMLAEVKALVRTEQRKADRRRKQYFKPDLSSVAGYEQSTSKYRDELIGMLGWPLTDGWSTDVPSASTKHVATDSLGRISRILVETLPGVHTYGLFFRPKGKGPFPLVISQHGGGGTPELCSGFFGSANYNDMTRRVLRRGIAVFAPQLHLWNPESFGPDPEQHIIDRRLKQIGGSLAALELYRIFRSLDYFAARRDIDANRIGMMGLSYGGFYTLFAAAMDARIRVAVSSCFFNNRKMYDFADWVWFNAANQFMDAEVGALVCPRPLYVEVGKKDDLFRVRHARPEARKLAAIYQRLGVPDRFHYEEHPGGHELDKSDQGIDFLCRHLGADL